MKLVVTGQDRDGVSVFVADEEHEPVVAPGFEMFGNTPLWGAEGTPNLPRDTAGASGGSFFPPLGGHRFFLLDIGPDSTSATLPPPSPKQSRDFDALFPGLVDTWEPDDPGMHTSDTVDFGVVISGTVVLEVDGQAERTLATGDAFVQNGARHRWRNPSAGPARLAVFMIGAARAR